MFSSRLPLPIPKRVSTPSTTWDCSLCTLTNEAASVSCVVCGTSAATVSSTDSGKALDRQCQSPEKHSVIAISVSMVRQSGGECVGDSTLYFEDEAQALRAFTELVEVAKHRQESVSEPLSSAGDPQQAVSDGTSGRNISNEGRVYYDSKRGVVRAEDGLLYGPTHAENRANAGAIGGERVERGRDNAFDSRGITGRPNAPPAVDEIKLSGRSESRRLEDGGGARVNHQSGDRQYNLGNYERTVRIDPTRNTHRPVRERNILTAAGTSDEHTAHGVPLEVAATGAKIKNMHKSTGERVKELDFFVSSVETPIMRVLLGDGTASTVRTDISAYVNAALLVELTQRGTRRAIQSMDGRGSFDVAVEGIYLDKDTGNVPVVILEYCRIFHSLLSIVLGIIDQPQTPIVVYYLTTVRADELVLAKSSDGALYANAMCFEQAMCCALSSVGVPLHIDPAKISDTLAYWITRTVSAVRKVGTPSSSLGALGMYDATVRHRFEDQVRRMQGRKEDPRVSELIAIFDGQYTKEQLESLLSRSGGDMQRAVDTILMQAM
jgi:hypothetical protein